MPKQNADFLEVLIGQMGECRDINPVFSETLGVLGHAELFEPICNLLHGGPLRISRYPFWTGWTEILPHTPTCCSSCRRGCGSAQGQQAKSPDISCTSPYASAADLYRTSREVGEVP